MSPRHGVEFSPWLLFLQLMLNCRWRRYQPRHGNMYFGSRLRKAEGLDYSRALLYRHLYDELHDRTALDRLQITERPGYGGWG